MKFNPIHLGAVCLMLITTTLQAATFYVDIGNPNPAPPFADWTTAATNIQDAIDAATNGDLVLVTNGVYQTGGKVMAGDLTNRIAIDKAVTVQSVNGPGVTTLLGAGAINGTAAVRCVWLTNDATLVGFTVMGGATRYTGDITTLQCGGGIWCASSNALVGNCLIVSNTAYQNGAGLYRGKAINSLISRNGTISGAGATHQSLLNNCTIIYNTTLGANGPIAMTNCIIYYNSGNGNGNYAAGGSAFSHCCTTPALAGTGNFTNAPQLLGDTGHLAINSPCIGAGMINPVTGTDVFGNAWSNPPSVGCAEWLSSPVVTPAQIQFSGYPISFTVGIAGVAGQTPFTVAWFKDALPLQDNGHFGSTQTTNLIATGLTPADAGNYQLVVSNAFGVVTSAVAQLVIHCVDAASTNPSAPYSNWENAASNIQDAIDASVNGDLIVVTNGTYRTGGKIMAGNLTNRIAIDKAVTVQSVNGPSVTTILGAGATNGAAAVRCAWLTNGAALMGFTVMGGATRTLGDTTLQYGGGIWCASSNALVGNCLIVSNTANANGGGLYQGKAINSLISRNGPVFTGSASFQSVLNNCTVISNTTCGVMFPAAMTNCIIYFNNGSGNGNFVVVSGVFSHCCTTPALQGTGNFTNSPQLFADGVHLTTTSPCLGAGINLTVGTDVFGNVWSNPPSVGCAEWLPSPVVTAPQIKFSGNPIGFTIGNQAVEGSSPLSFAWLKDGIPLQDNGHFSGTQTTNLIATDVSPTDGGNYQLVVSNSFGVVTSSVASLVIHYVDVAGTSPIAPYATWATAATNIQDAITAAAAGDVILVANGLYATGGKTMDGIITNRVSVDKAILVQSVNGPSATTIQGAWDVTTTNGPGAIRCAWLTNNAILSGFTLYGGATRSTTTSRNSSMYGGGVFGTSSNNSTVYNCVLATNYAFCDGGGACWVTLNRCTLIGNHAEGSSKGYGNGGGAICCILTNCLVTANSAAQGSGGGVENCNLVNCALTKNSAYLKGSGACAGSLVNCTVTANTNTATGGDSTIYGTAVYGAALTNCIVWGNFSGTGYSKANTNFDSCTMAYCCASPLATGIGNLEVNPQLLADGIHLAATSPCLGAGTASVISGTDLDGQPWNNPPAIGCDEWQPTPIIVTPLTYQVNTPNHGLTFNIDIAGQSPFNFFWIKDGTPIQNDGHYSNSETANLVINRFGPEDSGIYQVVATNVSGSATSQVAQVIIHAVAADGTNPIAPYLTWATAATNIQDAVNVAAVSDIVLVTNGLYATGGKVMSGDLTNRVAVDKAITVTSVNGYTTTVIQGAWDPVTTNGSGAVRCVYLADGAVLNGFTLKDGATRYRYPQEYEDGSGLYGGGGVYCNSYYGIVANCVLSNNSAIYGGGIRSGTLNNSLVTFNLAVTGGGAYYSLLNNCTVINNYSTMQFIYRGAGTFNSIVRNSIVLRNYDINPGYSDNYNNPTGMDIYFFYYTYSCTSPTKSGTGNINVDPQFLDGFHIASTSPCRGAGNAAYTAGVDLDGEVWTNPPSMGCDEVIMANLGGPLLIGLVGLDHQTNLLVNRYYGFSGNIYGRATQAEWAFGDGSPAVNAGISVSHQWTNAGNYTLTFTAYNNDYPAGVSTNLAIQVLALNVPQLQTAIQLTNGFQFQFAGQVDANYTIEYTTNLLSPSWETLQKVYFSTGGIIQINDPAWTNEARFYRVLAQ